MVYGKLVKYEEMLDDLKIICFAHNASATPEFIGSIIVEVFSSA